MAAVFYAIFSISFAMVMGIASALSPAKDAMPFWFVVAIPIFYVVAGFLFMSEIVRCQGEAS